MHLRYFVAILLYLIVSYTHISVGTGGSNATGVEKMNPVCIHIFDINTSKSISNHFLDICLTGGEDGAKAYKIFDAIENEVTKSDFPWSNCTNLSVDNCSTMIRVRNSTASRFLNKNPNVYISCCPCLLAHIAASHANDVFSNLIGFNIEKVCIDSFYWFDRSSKKAFGIL